MRDWNVILMDLDQLIAQLAKEAEEPVRDWNRCFLQQPLGLYVAKEAEEPVRDWNNP